MSEKGARQDLIRADSRCALIDAVYICLSRVRKNEN
jgi:hypothetical protein